MRASQFMFIMTYYIVCIESQMQPFIVDGKDAQIINFPYVAFIGAKCIDEQSEYITTWFCGSSIVNQNIILTAGHCVHGCIEDTAITVSAGNESKIENGVVSADSYLIHDDFDVATLRNDIAILKLKSPLVFNNTVNRVALMESPPYGEQAVVAGWGLINEDEGTETTTLQYTEQIVWEKSDCLDIFRFMPKGVFCARNPHSDGYTALGDSGSALVVNGYIQLGIVSAKDPDISPTIALYTDVGYFYKWIQRSVKTIMCHQD